LGPHVLCLYFTKHQYSLFTGFRPRRTSLGLANPVGGTNNKAQNRFLKKRFFIDKISIKEYKIVASSLTFFLERMQT
jgi:hypothetical protein